MPSLSMIKLLIKKEWEAEEVAVEVVVEVAIKGVQKEVAAEGDLQVNPLLVNKNDFKFHLYT
jgi:hypothetical protein